MFYQHNKPQFSIEEPPAPKKKPNGRTSRGHRKDKYDAINFCISETGQWCKLFVYEYKDGTNLIDGVVVEWDSKDKAMAKKNAYIGCYNRKQKLLKLAKELGVVVEVYVHNDWEEKEYSVYAIVTGYSNENE